MAAPLTGEVALVTGAGRGIGRAIALKLASLGAKVGVTCRTCDELDETAGLIGRAGGTAIKAEGDVLLSEDVARVVEKVAAAAGGLTILVNNAGTGRSAPFAKTSRALWDEMIALDLTSVFTVTQAALPHMLGAGHGRIVNVASVAGLKGYPYISAYCAAKHGVVGLTRALAVELAGKKITVNAVCPGYVDTPMTDRNLATMAEKTGKKLEDLKRQIELMTPQHRMFQPEEVADAVAYLCSPAARGVTGQTLPIDGGELSS